MDRSEIRDILRKKDGGKINSYILRNAKKKQAQCDLLNLLQNWVHCLLYYKNIYPQQAFSQRKILGVSVYTASSIPLRQYLDDFFLKIKPQLLHLNKIQIIVFSSQDRILQINRLHIHDYSCFQQMENEDDQQYLKPANKAQNQIQFKSFLFDLKEKLSNGYTRRDEERVSFKFRIGYRMEQSNPKNTSFILENWVKRQKIDTQGQILMSLKSQKLNLIYQIIR